MTYSGTFSLSFEFNVWKTLQSTLEPHHMIPSLMDVSLEDHRIFTASTFRVHKTIRVEYEKIISLSFLILFQQQNIALCFASCPFCYSVFYMACMCWQRVVSRATIPYGKL